MVVQEEKEKKEEEVMKRLQSWAPFTSSPISRTAAPTYAMGASSLRKRYTSSSLFLSGLLLSLLSSPAYRLKPRHWRSRFLRLIA